MRGTNFPVAITSDPEDVAVALETAQALWRKLDYQEAVRWLRRAALAAEESGDDLRGVRLAAAAADLTTELSSAPPRSAGSSSAPPLPRGAAPSARPNQAASS